MERRKERWRKDKKREENGEEVVVVMSYKQINRNMYEKGNEIIFFFLIQYLIVFIQF